MGYWKVVCVEKVSGWDIEKLSGWDTVMSRGDVVAVFGVDPGSVTGAGSAVVDLSLGGTVGDALRSASRAGFVEAWEVAGDPDDQAVALAEEVLNWTAELLLGGTVCAGDVWVACESFALRGNRALSGSGVLDPVRVGWGLRAVLRSRGWEGSWAWQTPAAAKGYATNARLRDWDLWVVGSEHMRDAQRHVALRVAKLA